MLRYLTCAMALCVLLLSGCAGQQQGEESLWEEARMHLQQAQQISLQAEITTDTSDGVFTCTLDCVCDEAGMKLRVIEPSVCEGITARWDREQMHLVWDDWQLCLGLGSDTSPLQALPFCLEAIENGHTQQVWTEHTDTQAYVVAQLRARDELTALVYLDLDTALPVCADLYDGEVRCHHCLLRDVRVIYN